MESKQELIQRIINLNHAWKLSRDEFGPKHPITNSLRTQKSSWQVNLLRLHPLFVYLKVDHENSSEDEVLLSVRLKSSISIDGVIRKDAEHIPLRIAESLMLKHELEQHILEK